MSKDEMQEVRSTLHDLAELNSSQAAMQEFKNQVQQMVASELQLCIQAIRREAQERQDSEKKLRESCYGNAVEIQKIREAIRCESQERQVREKQLHESCHNNLLEIQKVRGDAERWMIECAVALQDDFITERTKLAEQVCELTRGLWQTCQALNRAMTMLQAEQAAGGRKSLLLEVGNMSDHLAKKANELLQSENVQREQGIYNRFKNVSNYFPKTAMAGKLQAQYGNSTKTGNRTSCRSPNRNDLSMGFFATDGPASTPQMHPSHDPSPALQHKTEAN
eukprot:gnl/MRDRNA2_/MRDRNA2_23870_c0_seq1.p1 gnl/MRDRNA2_/MRDRNA2_23870_c0~~gnl/MRDRNA2_/MRDRNA2_23870_c0_seq1.p1  ORF type:complete len:318 (-),score=61.22 gnl/MRDRNA2_/MRDRNA2_23870_c0_seq1:34-870(-)